MKDIPSHLNSFRWEIIGTGKAIKGKPVYIY
jgi:hypothetical protein